jgi:hypothetical protein
MDYRPRMRADLERELGPDGAPGQLHDPLVNRDVTLGPVANAVARRLDGSRSVDDVAADLGRPRAAVEDSVRTLSHLNLVEGAGAVIAEHVGRVRRGELSAPYLHLDGTRFGCQGSGNCCQNYTLGPLDPADLALLESLPIREHFPHLGDGPYWEWREFAAIGRRAYLKTVSDACVFLEGCHCGLHTRFGSEMKPGMCRFYPYEELITAAGRQIYDGGGCSQYSFSARSGPLLADELPRILPLLPPQSLHHPIVILDEGLPVDYGYIQPLLRAAVDEVAAAHAGAPESLRAVARRARALAGALRRSPLGPDEPGATVAAVVAQPAQPFYAASSEAPTAGAAAIAEVAAALLGSVTLPIAEAHARARDYYSAKQARALVEILHLIHVVAAQVADPAVELPDYYREIGAITVDDPDLDDVLRRSLRQTLHGERILIRDELPAGLLGCGMLQLVALFGARMEAAREGRSAAVAADLNRGHMLATRALYRTANDKVVRAHAPLTWTALEALPALARWR